VPGDGLSPDDVPQGQVSEERVRALLRAYEAGVDQTPHRLADFNAELDAAAAIDWAMHTAALQAFRAAFVGPPLPRGFRARQERERRRRADLRALLKRMREG
jgi:hypothetical protein